MRFPSWHRWASLLLIAMLATGASAAEKQDKKKKGKDKAATTAPAGAAGAAEKPFAEWSKITKDAEQKKGFLTLWKKRDNLYLELSREQLGQPFLYVVSLARGIGSNFVLGGLPVDDRVLQFERHGDRVLLIEVNTRLEAPAGTPIGRARELSVPNSIVQSFKIESEQDSSKVLIDLGSLLLSDVTDLSERLKESFNNVSVRFDKERSVLGSLKTFPDNSELEATLTFVPNDRSRLQLEAVPDNRYIPVGVHYSFTRLPANPMPPRYADNRVGFFLGATKDFSRDEKESFWLRHINRWRLEKKDASAAVSEPVKPIVYYIDRTVPDKFRPWVKEGVEKWQKAFEAAGFKAAIVAKDAPADDPDWDAEDVRYSTIRWITSSEPSFGAIGPSRVDPRTGEIFDSDLLFEANMFQGFANAYRRYVGPETIAEAVLPEHALNRIPPGLELERLCMAGDGLVMAGELQRITLLMDGSLEPGSPVPDEYMRLATVWVTMHEVGHALGLRHNFRSSTSTPYAQLQDQSFTGARGLYSSVMEYPSPNIDYSRAKQGDWYTTTAGTYDVWAIRYGYTPSGAATPDEDYAMVRKIADESQQAGHEYSTDEDTYPSDAPDPRSNIYDLGDDPLQFARDRTAFLTKQWRSPAFEARVVGKGDLTALRRAMESMVLQYAIASGMAIKYLGGSYMSRIERGQPGEKDPVDPVPAAKQREAVDFLAKNVWASDAMSAPGKLLERLAPNRWSHWGMGPGGTFTGRQDYAWNDRVLAIQTAAMNGVTAPALLARMREQENRSAEAYRLAEHFDRVTKALWGEVGGASPAAIKPLEGPHTRRELQRAFVDRLATMVVDPPPTLPDDARALARLTLTRVDARCARALAAEGPMGDNTRAHLLESRARIRRALEASRSADPSPPARPPGAFGAPTGTP